MPKNLNLTVVVQMESFGEFSKLVGQCVEYDICVQGDTMGQVKERFIETILGHIAIAAKHGKEPFDCLPKGVIKLPPEVCMTGKFPLSLMRGLSMLDTDQEPSEVPEGELQLAVI